MTIEKTTRSGDATPIDEVERLTSLAARAAPNLAGSSPAERASWLRAAATALDAHAEELVEIAARETRLPASPRLTGELVRTTFQLRLFAEVLEDGAYLAATIDRVDGAWPMGPRPDLRRSVVPIGPVLVFAASNFPFAFSVAGGDTASALAAGCPVIVKAHPGHPELSARVHDVLAGALVGAGAPDGVVSLIHGVDAGTAALRSPSVAAAAFTGSVRGGRALFDIACARARPIPFYGELGSVNPVVVTEAAVRARGAAIAAAYVGSFTLGCGQFCTKPGLLLLPSEADIWDELADAVRAVEPQPMLNSDIARGYRGRLDELMAAAEVVAQSASSDPDEPGATLLRVTAQQFLDDPERLGEECFGPVSLVVTYDGEAELFRLLERVTPSLTASFQAEDSDAQRVRDLLPAMTAVAGRILFNDWPTGVTVSWAQQHGGPYPATTSPTTTSVGTAGIERFLRPVAWQSFPDELLPPALQNDNPWRVPRRENGQR